MDRTEGTSVFCTNRGQWVDRIRLLLRHPYLPLCVFSEHAIHARSQQNGDGSGGTNPDCGHEDKTEPMITMPFVQPFAACVISLARRAAVGAKNNKNKSLGASSSSSCSSTPSGDATGFGIKVSTAGLQSEDEDSSSGGEEQDDEEDEEEEDDEEKGAAEQAGTTHSRQHAANCQVWTCCDCCDGCSCLCESWGCIDGVSSLLFFAALPCLAQQHILSHPKYTHHLFTLTLILTLTFPSL